MADNLGKRTTSRSAVRVVVSVGPQRQVKFAVWAEYGIKAHVIQPKRRSRGGKQALSIPGWGVYRRVHHPGVAKRPFLRPAYEAQSGNAQDAMGRETKRLIRAKPMRRRRASDAPDSHPERVVQDHLAAPQPTSQRKGAKEAKNAKNCNSKEKQQQGVGSGE